MAQIAYEVYRNKEHFDTVFYNAKCEGGAPITASDVKQSLVDHDGYPRDIIVICQRKQKGH